MNYEKVSRWVDFVVSEMTIKELEDFNEKLRQVVEEKKRVLFEQPLSANPKKFKGVKIEDTELVMRTKNILLGRKYKTIEQVVKLSRNQLLELGEYGLSKKTLSEIIYFFADDKTDIIC